MNGRGWWMVALMGACGKDDTGTTIVPPPEETATETATDTGTPPPPAPGPSLDVSAKHNYTLTQELQISAVTVREKDDVLVNWALAATDMFGQPLTPGAVQEFRLLEVYAPSSQVANRFEKEDFGFDLLGEWAATVFGETSSGIDVLAEGGQPFVPLNYFLENDNKTWVATLMVEDAYGLLQPRAYVALDPIVGGDTSAQLTASTSSLTWSAILGEKLVTAAGWPGKDPGSYYQVDWRVLGNDALGKDYDKAQGDVLFFGKVDGMSSKDIATNLLDLRSHSSIWYEMDVLNEDDARLDLAKTAEGAVFHDFTPGTWVIGVACTKCYAPFPLWVSELEVQSM